MVTTREYSPAVKSEADDVNAQRNGEAEIGNISAPIVRVSYGRRPLGLTR
jgi:hypothetical protein